ncbi:MAG: membrane protein insertion efficiency factor YidD [bacterium]|nr:membrane protein insertion efficiency factor YidD [bacterium]
MKLISLRTILFRAVSGVFHLIALLYLFLLFGIFWLWKKISRLLLGDACRFYPTCSEYMYIAILNHGFIKGLFLGGRRLCRCHPLAEGGFDPVPENTVRRRNGDG